MKKQKLITQCKQFIIAAEQMEATLYNEEFEQIVKELDKRFPQFASISLSSYGRRLITLLEKK